MRTSNKYMNIQHDFRLELRKKLFYLQGFIYLQNRGPVNSASAERKAYGIYSVFFGVGFFCLAC